MAIWTSRYSNKELPEGNYFAVGISLGKPKFGINYILRKQCYDLAPDRWMWGKELDEFRSLYFKKLDKMGVARVKNILEVLNAEAKAFEMDLVLLCFEDVRMPEDWCHRTMLAEWVKANIGWDMKELPDPTPPKIKKAVQQKQQQESNNSYKQLSLFDICNA